MRRRTKIICTLGPSCSSYEQISSLMRAGMNVARLNFSHGTHDDHLEKINIIKKARQDLQMAVAILLDTKGPEMRVGLFKEGKLSIEDGELVALVAQAQGGGKFKEIEVHPAEILTGLNVGMRVLFDDGNLQAEIESIGSAAFFLRFAKGGVLFSRKGINIPGLRVGLPRVTPQDEKDIAFGCKAGVDLIAASFVRDPEQILQIRALTYALGRGDIPIIAKIENEQGIDHFDAILEVADGIMVARGDLGVEIPLERVPLLQKMMVEKALEACKPVVIATQMLESMIHNPRPTRAEVSDVAAATYQMATALMLSAETAAGSYPLESVTMMARIIEQVESTIDYHQKFDALARHSVINLGYSVAVASVKLSMTSNQFKALLAPTTSGGTARMLSSLRPHIPVFAPTHDIKLYHQMAFLWGVIPIYSRVEKIDGIVDDLRKSSFGEEEFAPGQIVVACYGVPWGVAGTTNTIRCIYIGHKPLATRPFARSAGYICAQIVIFDGRVLKHKMAVDGKIVLVTHCKEEDLFLLEGAAALIYAPLDPHAGIEAILCRLATEKGVSLFLDAEGADCHFRDGQLVTLDLQTGCLYLGFHEGL